jgi:hypothetical protein
MFANARVKRQADCTGSYVSFDRTGCAGEHTVGSGRWKQLPASAFHTGSASSQIFNIYDLHMIHQGASGASHSAAAVGPRCTSQGVEKCGFPCLLDKSNSFSTASERAYCHELKVVCLEKFKPACIACAGTFKNLMHEVHGRPSTCLWTCSMAAAAAQRQTTVSPSQLDRNNQNYWLISRLLISSLRPDKIAEAI